MVDYLPQASSVCRKCTIHFVQGGIINATEQKEVSKLLRSVGHRALVGPKFPAFVEDLFG
jgi:hypothetical protein